MLLSLLLASLRSSLRQQQKEPTPLPHATSLQTSSSPLAKLGGKQTVCWIGDAPAHKSSTTYTARGGRNAHVRRKLRPAGLAAVAISRCSRAATLRSTQSASASAGRSSAASVETHFAPNLAGKGEAPTTAPTKRPPLQQAQSRTALP
eukprot:2221479-Pleurochrysis_carterae.AAC.1